MAFRTILFLLLVLAAPLRASTAEISLLGGWREGSVHVAALEIGLEPGWKTYWRAPGAAGIPPRIDWSGSRNVKALRVAWPVPHVFFQNGLPSIGYAEGVILPLIVTPRDPAARVDLRLTVSVGVCREVCVPVTARIVGSLGATGGARDGRIVAALSDRPESEAESGAGPLECRLAPAAKGARITAEIAIPPLGPREHAVVELADPEIWVGVPELRRDGRILSLEVGMRPPRGRPIGFDRDTLRLTILGGDRAVEIRGCD